MASASAAAVNLEDVPSVDLMTELLRRMKCASKPDKRLILVGIYFSSASVFYFSLVGLSDPEAPFICREKIGVFVYVIAVIRVPFVDSARYPLSIFCIRGFKVMFSFAAIV